MRSFQNIQSGFSLIELIMVIVITGVLSGMVSTFIKKPIDQYMDINRRAELTDIADTALRRIGRDLRLAVPNSIRVPVATNASYIEFIPTKTGGRYRGNAIGGTGLCGADGDALSFSSADSCFEIIGQPITFQNTDYIVIGNTQASGNPAYDTTTTGVLRAYTGAVGAQSMVKMTATLLPSFAQLSSQRFAVVSGTEQAVTYACNGVALNNGEGQGELRRYWGYGFNLAQAAPAALGGSNTLLANKLSGCSIDYTQVNQRNALVAIRLTLTRGGESMSLYTEIHIINLP